MNARIFSRISMVTRKTTCYLFLIVSFCGNSFANSPIAEVSKAEIAAKSQFDDANAEIIKKVTRLSVDQNLKETGTTYIAIKLNSTDAINDYSQLTIGYDSHYEHAELDFANTISPEGKRQPIDKNSVQLQTPPSPFFYTDRKNIVFSLPSLQPGSTIEFQFTKTQLKTRIDNHWDTRLAFYYWQRINAAPGVRLDPIRQVEYEVSLPKELQVSDQVYNSKNNFNRKQKVKGDRRIYSWSASNIDEFIFETGMPHHQSLIPYVVLTSLKDWSVINEWAWGLFKSQDINHEEIQQLAAKLSAGKQDEIAKIKAVYEYIQDNIRYLYSHVGRGGYTPHSPKQVMDRGYGDCKDQTMLTVALLNAMGIKALPALVMTRNAGIFDSAQNLPTFDHMITYIPDAKHGINWLDTTGQGALFPGNFATLEGTDALVLSDQNSRFEHIPESAFDANNFSVNFLIDKISTEKTTGTVLLSYRGALEQSYRTLWLRNKQKEQLVKSFLKQLYPSIQVSDIVGHNSQNPFAPFYISANIAFDDAWKGKSEPFMASISFPTLWRMFFLPEALISPEERQWPFEVNKNYSIDLELTINQPHAGYFPTIETSGSSLESEFFTIKQDYSEYDDKIVVTASGKFNSGKFSKAEYTEWHQAHESFLQSPAWIIRYAQDEDRVVKKDLEKNQDSSIEAMNDLIQFHMDNGEFELALEKADQAIKRTDKNGRTYYLLGLSQAYMDQIEESEKSFKLARKNGYQF